jgi:predicted enzyme related to lactoylglutathione lyase
MNNRPIHFEVQADDAERAKKFYEATLGWKIEKTSMPGVGMDYWTVGTGTGPGIDGGLYKRADNMGRKLNSFDCTILVDDMDKAIAAIKANGGTIQPWEGKEKWEMQGLGWFSRAVDTEGNTFGLLQATEWQPK